MAIGQPNKNTMLLSLLSRQGRAGTGRHTRLPSKRYSNSMLGPEMSGGDLSMLDFGVSDADITGDMDVAAEPSESPQGTIGNAPAPTGKGVGIGVLAPLAKSIGKSVALSAIGIPSPPIDPVAMYQTVMKAINKGKIDAMNKAYNQDFMDINAELGGQHLGDTLSMTEEDEGFTVSEFGRTPITPDAPQIGPVDINANPYVDKLIGGESGVGGNVGPGGFGESGSPSGTSDAASSHEGVADSGFGEGEGDGDGK